MPGCGTSCFAQFCTEMAVSSVSDRPASSVRGLASQPITGAADLDERSPLPLLCSSGRSALSGDGRRSRSARDVRPHNIRREVVAASAMVPVHVRVWALYCVSDARGFRLPSCSVNRWSIPSGTASAIMCRVLGCTPLSLQCLMVSGWGVEAAVQVRHDRLDSSLNRPSRCGKWPGKTYTVPPWRVCCRGMAQALPVQSRRLFSPVRGQASPLPVRLSPGRSGCRWGHLPHSSMCACFACCPLLARPGYGEAQRVGQFPAVAGADGAHAGAVRGYGQHDGHVAVAVWLDLYPLLDVETL